HQLPVAPIQIARVGQRTHMLDRSIQPALIPIAAPPARVEILKLVQCSLDVPLITVAAEDPSPAAATGAPAHPFHIAHHTVDRIVAPVVSTVSAAVSIIAIPILSMR